MYVIKGSPKKGICKGQTVTILSIEPMGPDFSHSAKIKIQIGDKTHTGWVSHPNRVNDDAFNVSFPMALTSIRVSK